MLEDHLACPALQRWLPDLLEAAHTWIAPDHRPPRAIVRLLARWSAVPDDRSALGALVLATPLRLRTACEVPAALIGRVEVGSTIVELATIESRRLASIWRPARTRRAVMLAVAERARHWAARGLVGLEQWAALEPPSTVVTLGTRGPHTR